MDYDIIIVGAGFSGSETAYVLAKAGWRVGLITQSLDSVFLPFGQVSPPFPQGSLLAVVGSEGLKGWELHSKAKYHLESLPNLHLLQLSVSSLVVEDGSAIGVSSWEGLTKTAAKIVLAVGSFVAPVLTIGTVEENAGRLSEVAYIDLFENLKSLGFGFERLEREVLVQADTLGYSVEFSHFAKDEWTEANFELGRLKNLYGLGLCVKPLGDYAEMSSEGQRFAEYLLVEASK